MSSIPSAIAPLLAELDQEAVATRRLLERLPAEHLSWRPHLKSYSLGQQAWHVATIPGGVMGMLQADQVDAETVDFSTPQPAAVSAIQQAFEESLSSARDLLSGWGEAELARMWSLRKSGAEILAQPRGVMLRMLAFSHLYHHRGQLALYLRLLDVPLPSIYGPTADESPFG